MQNTKKLIMIFNNLSTLFSFILSNPTTIQWVLTYRFSKIFSKSKPKICYILSIVRIWNSIPTSTKTQCFRLFKI